MPTFSTPEPIRAFVEVSGAWITVTAGDAPETTVTVRPHNPNRTGDVELAEKITVDFADSRLQVRSPRGTRWRLRNLIGAGERVDLELSLPTGSDLEIRGWGDVTTHGALGAIDIDAGMGDLRLDRATGDVRAKTAMGDVRLESADGAADLKTATGLVQAGRVGGDVAARTSAGDIRLGSVRRGSVTASTSYGQLEIGVATGTAAWLDIDARHGVVRSELESTDGPGDAELTVEIHARTGYGDIILRRVS